MLEHNKENCELIQEHKDLENILRMCFKRDYKERPNST